LKQNISELELQLKSENESYEHLNVSTSITNPNKRKSDNETEELSKIRRITKNNGFVFQIHSSIYLEYVKWANKNINKTRNKPNTWMNRIQPILNKLNIHLIQIGELKNEALIVGLNNKTTDLSKLNKKRIKINDKDIYVIRKAPCSCEVNFSFKLPFSLHENDSDYIDIDVKKHNNHKLNCQLH
jgi:hypothetical protein